VTPEELPDTATVRRKVSDFERNFVTVFCDAFQCLAPLNQLAAVSVATRPDRANQAVSLLQYLESDAIPVYLLTAKDGSTRAEDREFFLTIDPARHVIFFYRAMLCIARTMPPQDICLYVCLSVRLSHAGILSKRLNISSTFLHFG